MSGQPLLLTDIGPPCVLVPWCTTQLGGAQRRSVVHNVVLYQRGGAQHSSHKPMHLRTEAAVFITSTSDAGGNEVNMLHFAIHSRM